MPSRILREGILDSRRVSLLSERAELFYRKLHSYVDDYGRCEYDPILLIARLYVHRLQQVTAPEIEAWVEECETAHCKCDEGDALVLKYKIGRKTYLQVNNFGQRTRSESKCPAPDGWRQDSSKGQEGFVYFARSVSTGKIKIGFTVFKPELRLSALQIGSAEKLELLGSIAGPKKLEREIHTQFAPYRQNGEWFEPSEDILIFISDRRDVPSDASKCAQVPALASRATTSTSTSTSTSKELDSEFPVSEIGIEGWPDLVEVAEVAQMSLDASPASDACQRIWKFLDFGARQDAIQGIRARVENGQYSDPGFVPALEKYLRGKKWRESLRAPPQLNGRRPASHAHELFRQLEEKWAHGR